MAATFHANLDRTLDNVRLELGDTDPASAVLQDETIDALYASYAGEATTLRRYQLTVLAAARASLLFIARMPVKAAIEGAGEADWRARLPALEALVARYARLTGDPGATAGYAAAGAISHGGSLLTPFDEE